MLLKPRNSPIQSNGKQVDTFRKKELFGIQLFQKLPRFSTLVPTPAVTFVTGSGSHGNSRDALPFRFEASAGFYFVRAVSTLVTIGRHDDHIFEVGYFHHLR